MRLVLSALLALTLVAPASAANFVRKPRILVVTNDGYGTLNAHRENWNIVSNLLRAHGMIPYLSQSPNNKPLIGYTQGLGATLGWPNNFDGLVVLGWDSFFPVGEVRLDSMTITGKFPTIPVLFIDARNGFCPQGSFMYSGAPTYQFTASKSVVSLHGTQYRLAVDTSVRGHIIPDDSTGVEKLVTGIASTDTTFVWRRAKGAGITYVTTTAGGDGQLKALPQTLIGMARWMADLPDSVRPNPQFRLGIIIDDLFLRNKTTLAAVTYEDLPTVSVYVDSLKARGIKFTVGAEAVADTMDALDPNGRTRIQNELPIWNSGYTKFYVHNHTGVDVAMQVSNGNASVANGRLWDLYGSRRNRQCSPTDTADSSFYSLHLAARNLLASRVGRDKLSGGAGPPGGDYSPANLNSSACKYEDLLSSLRRAGYNSILFNGRGCLHGVDMTAFDGSEGFDCGPGIKATPYGDIKLTMLSPGGVSPPFDTSAPVSSLVRYTNLIFHLGPYLVGNVGEQATSGVNPNGFSPYVTQHVRNYAGSGPGWTIIQDLDNFFRACNRLTGRQTYGWDWVDDLPATAPW